MVLDEDDSILFGWVIRDAMWNEYSVWGHHKEVCISSALSFNYIFREFFQVIM